MFSFLIRAIESTKECKDLRLLCTDQRNDVEFIRKWVLTRQKSRTRLVLVQRKRDRDRDRGENIPLYEHHKNLLPLLEDL